jgi:hypothetical protein
MNHLDKYLLSKQAGIADWMPDPTFETTASQGIGTDVGNFFKGVGNMFADPITGLFSGDIKKTVGSLGMGALMFVPGGRGVAGVGQAAKGLAAAGHTGRTASSIAKQLTPWGKTVAMPVGATGTGTMAGVKHGIGFGEALKNSYKFWKPGWGKGMVHGVMGTPWRAAAYGGLGGGVPVAMGRAGIGGEQMQEGQGFNPSALAPAAAAMIAALRGGGGAGAAAKRMGMPGAGSGLQTEGLGFKAY